MAQQSHLVLCSHGKLCEFLSTLIYSFVFSFWKTVTTLEHSIWSNQYLCAQGTVTHILLQNKLCLIFPKMRAVFLHWQYFIPNMGPQEDPNHQKNHLNYYQVPTWATVPVAQHCLLEWILMSSFWGSDHPWFNPWSAGLFWMVIWVLFYFNVLLSCFQSIWFTLVFIKFICLLAFNLSSATPPTYNSAF